jgi:hypothetical protein
MVALMFRVCHAWLLIRVACVCVCVCWMMGVDWLGASRVSPLMRAVYFDNNAVVLHGLSRCLSAKRRQAALVAVDSNGCTALHWAARSGNFVAVLILVGYGADVSARNCAGETAADVLRVRASASHSQWTQQALAGEQQWIDMLRDRRSLFSLDRLRDWAMLSTYHDFCNNLEHGSFDRDHVVDMTQ